MAAKIKKFAFVRCRGGSPLREGIDISSLPADCSEIKEKYPDGIRSCIYGCLGGGSCALVCPVGAISVAEGVPAVVDKDKCAGCGLCVNACPQHIIEVITEDANIQPKCSNADKGKDAAKGCVNSCIACRQCEKNCPADAVHVTDDHAVIDRTKCICCGMCAVKCPRGVIRDIFGIMTD